MLRIVLFFLLSGMLAGCGDNKSETSQQSSSSQAPLQIVTTIKPLQALLVAVVGDASSSTQLIPDTASPHTYTFRPSDIKKLKQADIVFRIDEHMEVMLNKVLGNNKKADVFSLAEIDGVNLKQIEGEHSDEHGKHEEEHHESVDFHLWASPDNAQAIVIFIAKTLIEKDPENASQYKNNRDDFIHQLDKESKKIQDLLSKHKEQKYVVFHNSWQYFSDYFGLKKPLIVNAQEGIMSGAKTFTRIRKQIQAENIACVFTDINVNSSILNILKEGQSINHAEIDVLASVIPLDKYTYIAWLQNMGSTINACLSK